jgi:hypothetical protein
MSLEISRLSRNDADWHQLVYLCRWTDTLIADEHGIYDPGSSADRMVLGVRGQVSELERDNSLHQSSHVADRSLEHPAQPSAIWITRQREAHAGDVMQEGAERVALGLGRGWHQADCHCS